MIQEQTKIKLQLYPWHPRVKIVQNISFLGFYILLISYAVLEYFNFFTASLDMLLVATTVLFIVSVTAGLLQLYRKNVGVCTVHELLEGQTIAIRIVLNIEQNLISSEDVTIDHILKNVRYWNNYLIDDKGRWHEFKVDANLKHLLAKVPYRGVDHIGFFNQKSMSFMVSWILMYH